MDAHQPLNKLRITELLRGHVEISPNTERKRAGGHALTYGSQDVDVSLTQLFRMVEVGGADNKLQTTRQMDDACYGSAANNLRPPTGLM